MRGHSIFLSVALVVGFALIEFVGTPIRQTTGVVATKAYYQAWFDRMKRCHVTVTTPIGTASTEYPTACESVPFAVGQNVALGVRRGRITRQLFAVLPK
jgi:hypothetical protein